MNPELEKLITSVKEAGSMTARQKEIILSKAKRFGDDIDEVEFVLEDVPIRDASRDEKSNGENRKKCPNCGAMIPVFSVVCPDCGTVINDETTGSKVVRQSFIELEKELNSLSIKRSVFSLNKFDYSERKKAELIASFSVPATPENLLQLLEFCLEQYERLPKVDNNLSSNNIVKNAWKSKIDYSFGLLKTIVNDHPEMASLLSRYKDRISRAYKFKATDLPVSVWMCIFILIFFILMISFELLILTVD